MPSRTICHPDPRRSISALLTGTLLIGFSVTALRAYEPPAQSARLSGTTRTLVDGVERLIQKGAVAPESPDVITTLDGEKILAWSQLGGGGTVICIRYVGADDIDRTPALGASQGGPANDQPSISADDRGNIGIFWRQGAGSALKLSDGSVVTLEGDAIVGRFFNSDATQPSTGDILISNASPDSANPKATTDKNGDTIVTWEEGDVVRGQRVRNGGAVEGPTFEVNDAFTSSAQGTVLDSSASGDFVAAWVERRQGLGLRVRRYDSEGRKKGTLITVSSSSTATAPQIAMADDGSFTVVWEDTADILARLYNANGTPKTPIFVVNQNQLGTQRRPALDANADGDFAVIWESDVSAKGAALQGGDLVGRFFDPTGAAETDEFTVAEENATTTPEQPKVTVDDRDTVTVVFDRRGSGGAPEGLFRKEFRTTADPEPCLINASTLCLNGNRFRVTTGFEANNGANGIGDATRITSDTGFFTFFDAANIEVVVKVLDACTINGSYWVFASGLTDVEVDLKVEDTQTGETVTYFNRSQSNFDPIQDTGAFATCGARPEGARYPQFSEASRAQVAATVTDWLGDVARQPETFIEQDASLTQSSLACSNNSTALCLTKNRFQVTSTFRPPNGGTGGARAVKLTPDTGYFWFFDAANVEVVIKVLDACGVNNRYWVFAGGLTDVRVDLEVTDTNSNKTRAYRNPQKTPFQTITDTNAFNSCP